MRCLACNRIISKKEEVSILDDYPLCSLGFGCDRYSQERLDYLNSDLLNNLKDDPYEI